MPSFPVAAVRDVEFAAMGDYTTPPRMLHYIQHDSSPTVRPELVEGSPRPTP